VEFRLKNSAYAVLNITTRCVVHVLINERSFYSASKIWLNNWSYSDLKSFVVKQTLFSYEYNT